MYGMKKITIPRCTLTTLRASFVVLFLSIGVLPLSAQQRVVNGTVYDDAGNKIVGAVVNVTGTDRNAITTENGSFSLQATPNETLTVTYFGHKNVVVPANQTNVNVTLEADNTMLEDVVVVGYGQQRRATLTGAVSQVNSKEIVTTKNENVFNSLSGKIPGLRVMQLSAQPGDFGDGAIRMDIRGMGDPLVVIDGIPRSKDILARMNPSEIESVSVLKDAAAAIYGVQAANGAILVISKQGATTQDGKFDISFSGNYGIQNFINTPDPADAVTFMTLINEKTFNNFGSNYPFRTNPLYTQAQIDEYASGNVKSTDWADVLFDGNVPMYNYDVSVSGGTDKINTFFNVGYENQESSYTTKSVSYDQWNFRNNTNVKITKRLSAVLQLSGSKEFYTRPNGDALWWTYKNAWIERPTAPVYYNDEPGKYAYYDGRTMTLNNALQHIDSNSVGSVDEDMYKFQGSAQLNYEIPGIKGLTASARYYYHYWMNDVTTSTPQFYVWDSNGVATPKRNDTRLHRRMDPGHQELLLYSLQYKNKFGDHSVGGYLAWEEQYSYNYGIQGSTVMLLKSNYISNGELSGRSFDQANLGESARRALIGRFEYNFRDKYMLEFIFRNDASSNFSKLGTWGFFPSVLGAWRISEEGFIKDNFSFVDNLKLRVSYGKTGQDGGAGRAVQGYSMRPNNTAWFYDPASMVLTGGVTTNALPNENLTWYDLKVANIGLDFDLWNGKLGGTVEVYQRKRSGLYARPTASVPAEVGANLPQVNMEKDQNFGWEFELRHMNRLGDWRYNVSANFSATKARWDYKQNSPARNSLENYRRDEVSGRNKNIWFMNEEEGGRFTSYEQIADHFMPVDQGRLPGDYWYEDWNGDGVINDNDKHPVATNSLPTFYYGINMGAAWRGIDISLNWSGAAGAFAEYGEVFSEVGPFNGGNVLTRYLDRWRTDSTDPWNPNAEWTSGLYPATGHSFTSGTTKIKNTSYLRLKTIELGYTFPNQWTETVGIRDCRIYVNVYNLLTFASKNMKGMDPERPGTNGSGIDDNGAFNYNYPNNRVVNFGFKLNF